MLSIHKRIIFPDECLDHARVMGHAMRQRNKFNSLFLFFHPQLGDSSRLHTMMAEISRVHRTRASRVLVCACDSCMLVCGRAGFACIVFEFILKSPLLSCVGKTRFTCAFNQYIAYTLQTHTLVNRSAHSQTYIKINGQPPSMLFSFCRELWSFLRHSASRFAKLFSWRWMIRKCIVCGRAKAHTLRCVLFFNFYFDDFLPFFGHHSLFEILRKKTRSRNCSFSSCSRAVASHRLPQSYGSRVSWELFEFQVLLFIYFMPLSFVTKKMWIFSTHTSYRALRMAIVLSHNRHTLCHSFVCLAECVVVAVVVHLVSHQYCIAFDFPPLDTRSWTWSARGLTNKFIAVFCAIVFVTIVCP